MPDHKEIARLKATGLPLDEDILIIDDYSLFDRLDKEDQDAQDMADQINFATLG